MLATQMCQTEARVEVLPLSERVKALHWIREEKNIIVEVASDLP